MRAGWIAAVVLALATVALFQPVVGHGFLNWDDPDVVAANPRLQQPPGEVAVWAATSRDMGHYQPLAWLALAAIAGQPPSAARVHAAAVGLHALNAALLLAVIALVIGHRGGHRHWVPAAIATALFAWHPLRVEPVAWASAFPYLLSFAPLLAASGAWIRWSRGGHTGWMVASLGLFAMSQLVRVTAPLFAVVLVAAWWASADGARRTAAELRRAVLPFAVLGLVFAGAEGWARGAESVTDYPFGVRLSWAVANPAVYLWRSVVPLGLTPLDPLPRVAAVDWGRTALGVAGGAAVVAATWRTWGRGAALALWGAYLALLLPVAGLVASGLQRTADRYTYGPAMVLAVAVAAVLAALRPAVQRLAVAAATVAAVGLAVPARAYVPSWQDSLSLWTRALAVDADNDVARYNLALADLSAGRNDEAEAHLERLLAEVPDHEPARRQLATLRADRAERTADAAAAAGRLEEAIRGYDEVLANDPARTRARLARGMALVQSGAAARAVADLEAGGAATSADPAVTGAMALAWAQGGRTGDAIALLRRQHAGTPGNLAVAMNLARLLLTAPAGAGRDPDAALALAAQVNDATGGSNPRVLATLAEALAATGRRSDAVQAWAVAIGLADESGDAALATDLRRRAGR